MRFDHSTTIQASPERVWEIFSNVERWPDWTPTVESVERLDAGRLHLGAKTRLRQPKLPVAVWEVTKFEDGQYFEWVSKAPGVTTTGGHRVISTPDGTVATATLIQEGPLSWLVGRLYAKLTMSYITTETERLKEACE
ncbi:SRPBCC family protein [Kribbella solani]|uniref:Putative membrane protein n=1 Tax=Kribbella solani TaxID=236067 RepID=A0A841DVS5_9ACTN|nr:SRPBCC family protein [Kribbella solani]MBB5980367.1 putative membrane protein [Kribbella solani]